MKINNINNHSIGEIVDLWHDGEVWSAKVIDIRYYFWDSTVKKKYKLQMTAIITKHGMLADYKEPTLIMGWYKAQNVFDQNFLLRKSKP